MKRLAVFVEGYTELLFVERLLEEVAGAHRILIEQRQISGGKNAPRRMKVIKAARALSGQRYFVLIFDCGGDHAVKTRISEEHENLTKQGYEKIIGLRDVRPDFSRAEIPKLVVGLTKYIKTSLIPVEFILSVLEIEAWFLADHTHFDKIDAAITVDAIQTTLGFNPQLDDMSARLFPTDDLDASYRLAGKSYSKAVSGNTVAALDYDFVYTELRNRIPYLDRLLVSLDDFLA